MFMVFRRIHSDKNFGIFFQKASQKASNLILKCSKSSNIQVVETIETFEIHL